MAGVLAVSRFAVVRFAVVFFSTAVLRTVDVFLEAVALGVSFVAGVFARVVLAVTGLAVVLALVAGDFALAVRF